MMLKDQLPERESWMFRWRRYLPVGLLPFALIALWESRDFAPRFDAGCRPICPALRVAPLPL